MEMPRIDASPCNAECAGRPGQAGRPPASSTFSGEDNLCAGGLLVELAD